MLSAVLIILSLTAMFKTEEYGVYFQVEENSFFLDEYDIWNGRVGSLLTCSQLCARQAVCSSANFVSKDGRCSLHRETRKMHLDRLLKQQGSFYVEKVVLTGTVISWDCKKALGMENGAISNAHISASSEYNYYFAAIHGRLQSFRGWAAYKSDISQWLQIDLGNLNTIVAGVATQGRSDHNSWVIKYKLQYSNDGANFQYYKEQGQIADKEFAGNTDSNTVVYHDLNLPIRARYIRFRPVAWYDHMTMRAELYGCQAA
ncbi:lactadherin-like [Oculina patagonica]